MRVPSLCATMPACNFGNIVRSPTWGNVTLSSLWILRFSVFIKKKDFVIFISSPFQLFSFLLSHHFSRRFSVSAAVFTFAKI